MYKPLMYAAVVLFLAGCQEKTTADLIVSNAKIITVDDSF